MFIQKFQIGQPVFFLKRTGENEFAIEPAVVTGAEINIEAYKDGKKTVLDPDSSFSSEKYKVITARGSGLTLEARLLHYNAEQAEREFKERKEKFPQFVLTGKPAKPSVVWKDGVPNP